MMINITIMYVCIMYCIGILKRSQSDLLCIDNVVYYTLGVFEGHFELFIVSSGAFVNFIQWRSCFWQFCVCHFGCLKNYISLALLQLRTS